MMKIFKIVLPVMLLFFTQINAQTSEKSSSETETKISYYQKRAKEDATFEQQFNAETKKDEKKFWKEQKNYEKSLKKKDKVAYEAYMEGKRDAYKEHHAHCDSHCHHSDYYHSHVRFYYYHNNNRPARRRSTVNARANLRLPSVRVGLF